MQVLLISSIFSSRYISKISLAIMLATFKSCEVQSLLSKLIRLTSWLVVCFSEFRIKYKWSLWLSNGIENLIRLNSNYSNASLAEARDLIGLIYPENFTIRGEQVQTTRINKVIECIYMINNELSRKKNGTKESFFSLSRKVTLTELQLLQSF